MNETKLLIKYNNFYMCEKNYNEINFIKIPNYHFTSSFSNISIFITLLISGYINEDFSTSIFLEELDWRNIFEKIFYS